MCAHSLNILLEKITKLLKFTSFLILRANFVIFADGGARNEIYLWVCWAVRHKSKSSSKRGLSLTHKKGVQSRPQYPLLSSPFIGTCFADKESGTCNVSKTLLAKISYEQDFLYCRCPVDSHPQCSLFYVSIDFFTGCILSYMACICLMRSIVLPF